MNHESSFACLTTDSGLVSEFLHVSPVFIRFGPRTRGRFADRRAARASRTDARQAARAATSSVAAGAAFVRTSSVTT